MTPTVAPVDLAEEAWYERVTSDATLTTELGHSTFEERVKRGHPRGLFGEDETPAARDFPLVTYFGVTGAEIRVDVGNVRIQVDIWVWPEGSDGGIGKLQAIDGRLYELFFEQWWTHDGVRFNCAETDFRNQIEGRDEPLHRIREFVIGVNG